MEWLELLLNLLLEVFVFGLVETLTRNLFHGRVSTLLSSQLAILILCTTVLFFHHTPCVLLVIVVAIFVRICITYWKQATKRNKFLSKPISREPQNHTTNTQGSITPYGDFPQRLSPPVQHISSQGTHSRGHGTRATSSYPIQNRHSEFSSTPYRSTQLAQATLKRKPLNNFSRSTSSKRPNSSQKLPSTESTQASFLSIRKNAALNYLGSMLDYGRTPSSCPPGLVNAGNTCFVNSTLQCLTWTPGFMDSLSPKVTQRNGISVLLSELNGVLHQIHVVPDGHSQYEHVSTSELLFVLSNFAPHLVMKQSGLSFQSQQDSAEFLLWLLNCVHTELRSEGPQDSLTALKAAKESCSSDLSKMKTTDQNFKSKLLEYSGLDWQLYTTQANSVVYGHFLGQLLEARECQVCNKVSLNIEYFMVLPLPLPTSTKLHDVFSLDSCFSLFSQVEDLVQSNMITCSCVLPYEQTLTPGRRRSLLSKPPTSLIIQLTRYSYNTTLQSTVKNKVCVQFPTSLRLPCTIESELGSEDNTALSVMYQLVGVCVHSGAENTSHGHYIAYCRTDDGWYYFNDETVYKVSDIEEEIKSYFVLQNAYLLFYSSLSE